MIKQFCAFPIILLFHQLQIEFSAETIPAVHCPLHPVQLVKSLWFIFTKHLLFTIKQIDLKQVQFFNLHQNDSDLHCNPKTLQGIL